MSRWVPFSVRLAVAVWAIALLAISSRVALAPPHSHTVVPIYLNAAERWWHGEDLYAPALPLDAYRYPPGFAAAFTPFTLMPQKTAGIAWRLLSAAVLLLGVHRIATAFSLSANQRGWLFTLTVVLSLQSLDNGQSNILLIGAVLCGVAATMRKNLWPAATWLVIAASVKVYPIAVALLLGLHQPRLVWRLLALSLAAVAMPFACAPAGYVIDEYRAFITAFVVDDRTASDFLFRVPHDWTMIPRVWLGVVVPAAVAQAVAVVAAVLFAAQRHNSPLKALLLGSLWMTLFGPATELPTWSLLGPAAALWVVLRPSRRSVWAVVLLLLPVLRGAFPPGMLECRSAAPLGALLLLADVLASSQIGSQTGGGVISSAGRLPASGRPLPARRLMTFTVMSSSQQI